MTMIILTALGTVIGAPITGPLVGPNRQMAKRTMCRVEWSGRAMAETRCFGSGRQR